MYNFDTIVDRTNTYSIKWDRDELPEGCRDAISMWIADMDFACSPDIVKAIQTRANIQYMVIQNAQKNIISPLLTG